MRYFLDHLIAHALDRPDDRAMIGLRPGVVETLTYRELCNAVAAFAQVLQPRVRHSAIVPILAAKSVDCVVAMLGILAAGPAVAVMNRKLKPPQLNAAFDAAKSPIGVIDAASLPILLNHPTESFAQVSWLVIGDDPAIVNNESAEASRPSSCFNFRSKIHSPSSLTLADRSPASAGCCLFTSGSTGNPKGVLIAERDLHRRATAEAALYGLTQDDMLLCVLPFSFDVGLNQLLSSIVAGATLVLSESWLPADMLRTAARFDVTGISGVPAVWNDLIQSTLRFDTKSEHAPLRYIAVSGGDLPVERLAKLKHVVGDAGIFKTYGQSETFRSTALRPEEFTARPHSVGRAFGDANVYVVRPDGTRAALDEPGEIVHTGLGTMLGYLDTDATNLRENPFFGTDDSSPLAVFTGDTGHLDAEGYVFVHGRADSMLKIAGNRVYPKEITDQLLAIGGIAEAAVVGRKDSVGETHLFAFVTPAPGVTLDGAALRRQLMTRVPSYMVPKMITILDSLPKTENGKIDYPALAETGVCNNAAAL